MNKPIMVGKKAGRAYQARCHMKGLLHFLLMIIGILATSTHAHDRNLTGEQSHSPGHGLTQCLEGNAGLKVARRPQLILTPQRVEELKQQIEEDAFSERFFGDLVL